MSTPSKVAALLAAILLWLAPAQADGIFNAGSGGGGSGGITSGATVCTGCVAGGILFNSAGVVTTDAGLLYGGSAGGVAMTIDSGVTQAATITFDSNVTATKYLFRLNASTKLDYNSSVANFWSFANGLSVAQGGTIRVADAAATGGIMMLGQAAGSDQVFGTIGASSNLVIRTNSVIRVRLTDTLMIFGPIAAATSAFPALKRSTTTLQVRLGDDSADTAIEASNFITGGPVPTGNTGTCNTGITVAGGSTAGTWLSTAICAIAGTIILTALPAAPTGHACFFSDRTTGGVVIEQTATTTTSATMVVRALPTGAVGTVASDVIQYECRAY
jgi:hypothetical protein